VGTLQEFGSIHCPQEVRNPANGERNTPVAPHLRDATIEITLANALLKVLELCDGIRGIHGLIP
jgi:hypothetical protein